MKIRTGQTIYETFVSVDTDNNPISAATINTNLLKNGEICNDCIINVSLTNEKNAIFTASWSASSIGSYQLYSKNETTNLIYMSDVYFVVPDTEEIAIVYVGV